MGLIKADRKNLEIPELAKSELYSPTYLKVYPPVKNPKKAEKTENINK